MESPASPKAFSGAISTVSVAQICLSAGYSSAKPSALRALSDIAIQYIQSIGRLAAAFATSQNRTDSNLFDLVLSLETLYSTRGFSGGSNPTRLVLQSSVLKELMAFVRVVDEVPFVKSIIRNKNRSNRNSFSISRSFAQLEKEAPPHVPRWLPCFPDVSDGRRRGKEEEPEMVNAVNGDFGWNVIEKKNEFDFILDLRKKRDRIRFSVGLREKKRRTTDLAVGL